MQSSEDAAGRCSQRRSIHRPSSQRRSTHRPSSRRRNNHQPAAGGAAAIDQAAIGGAAAGGAVASDVTVIGNENEAMLATLMIPNTEPFLLVKPAMKDVMTGRAGSVRDWMQKLQE